jgi:hypothetical protein
MKVVRAIGQAFDVCHKQHQSSTLTDSNKIDDTSTISSSPSSSDSMPKTAEVVANNQTRNLSSISNPTYSSRQTIKAKKNDNDTELLDTRSEFDHRNHQAQKQLQEFLTKALKVIEERLDLMSVKIDRMEENQSKLMSMMNEKTSSATSPSSSNGSSIVSSVARTTADNLALVAQYTGPNMMSNSMSPSFTFPIDCRSSVLPHPSSSTCPFTSSVITSTNSSSASRDLFSSLLNGYSLNNNSHKSSSVSTNNVNNNFLSKQHQPPSALILSSPERESLFSSGSFY